MRTSLIFARHDAMQSRRRRQDDAPDGRSPLRWTARGLIRNIMHPSQEGRWSSHAARRMWTYVDRYVRLQAHPMDQSRPGYLRCRTPMNAWMLHPIWKDFCTVAHKAIGDPAQSGPATTFAQLLFAQTPSSYMACSFLRFNTSIRTNKGTISSTFCSDGKHSVLCRRTTCVTTLGTWCWHLVQI